MTFPRLENWNQTVTGLHRGAQLLGSLQRLTQDPQPAYLELGLKVQPQGLFTGQLPAGGRVYLEFETPSLVYKGVGHEPVSFPLTGRSQADVFADLFGHLAEGEINEMLPSGGDLFERVSSGIGSRGGRYRAPHHAVLLDETQMEIDPRTSRDYWMSLQQIFTGIARFKAGLRGMQTPLVVWPHGFDLSTLWFAGNEINERKPHTNFGFSPRSEGIETPYLYAYAYPYPARFDPPALPGGAYWHTRGWTGAVIPYNVIAGQADVTGYVETSCTAIYQELIPILTNSL
jgi:hypothetical protein